MIYFLPNNVETEALLRAGQKLIKNPANWCKGAMSKGQSFCINGAMFEVGTPDPEMPDAFVSTNPQYFRGDLPRGYIPEPFWFLRQALKEIDTMAVYSREFENVGLFNDHPFTTHALVMALFEIAIQLVILERLTVKDYDSEFAF